jgi:hypothetical protein
MERDGTLRLKGLYADLDIEALERELALREAGDAG